MEGIGNSGNGKNLKKIRLRRIAPDLDRGLAGRAPDAQIRYGPFLWVNPYLLFLILILLILAFSPPYAWYAYILEEE